VTQKGDYGFAMGGRIEMTFDGYALNAEEMKLVDKEREKSDVAESMSFSMDLAEESLKEIKEDLEHFLKSDEEKKKEEEEKKKKEGEKKKSDDVNPFMVIVDGIRDIFRGKKKKEEKEKEKEISSAKDIEKDNFIEKATRSEAATGAAKGLYTIYDIYKKAHGMASAPGEGFKNLDESKAGEPDVRFRDVFHSKWDKVK
jgi:hypothetical protein